MEIPVESLAKLQLADGDTLVLKLKQPFASAEARERFTRHFSEFVQRLNPNVRAMVLEPHMDLEVLTPTSASITKDSISKEIKAACEQTKREVFFAFRVAGLPAPRHN